MLVFIALAASSCAKAPPNAASPTLETGVTTRPTRPAAPVAAAADGGAMTETTSADAAAMPPAKATVLPGTGVFVAPARPPVAQVTAETGGTVTFNFVNADVRDVLREILGNQLHLNYTIDSKIQTTITAQTGAPLARSAVLPMLAVVLQANGLGLIETNGVYRVATLADTARAGVGATAGAKAGYAVRILPLHYVAADELKAVLDPFVPPGSTIAADSARNLLIVTGPTGDLAGIAGLVRQFDVNWLKGTSFALYPLQIAMAKDVAKDLDQIFGQGGSSPLAGMVRIVPLERLNAILVISPQRSYLAQVKSWLDRFDIGADEMTPRIFEYHVQNSRAADLAAVLTKLLSSGAVSTVQVPVAPGSKVTTLIGQQSASGIGGMGSGLPGGSTIGGMPGLTSSVPGLGTSAAMPSPAGQAAGQAPPEPGGTTTQENALAPSGIGTGHGGREALELPPVRVVADEKNNTLVVYARPHDWRMIEDVIRRLDVVPLQVMIEATIAEVTLNDSLAYGLQFFLQRGANGVSFVNPPTANVPPPTNGTGAVGDVTAIYPGFNYVLSTTSARAILSALSAVTHVKVVSSPQLLVLDHQTATLQVGDEVPIITQQAQSTTTAGAPIINSVSYENTGVILQVTPRVNSSGLVALDIDQEVSNVATTTSSNIDSPTITERRIVSSVVVQDGQTVALGGLIQDNQSKTRSGIPVLSDIPIIGSLFSDTVNTDARTELLVLISPRIIRDGADARAMTEELRERMKSVKPLDAAVR